MHKIKNESILQTFFAILWLPEELVNNNNGPQFIAIDFVVYCRIKLSQTPPYHPGSNGAAKRSVLVVKQPMR